MHTSCAYLERLSFYLYMQAKITSKCIFWLENTDISFDKRIQIFQLMRQRHTYISHTGNMVEIWHLWTKSLTERYTQLHENGPIAKHSLWKYGCRSRTPRATILYKHYSKCAAIIGYGRFVWNHSKLNSRHINFYCKKLTQMEVGNGLLNVA